MAEPITPPPGRLVTDLPPTDDVTGSVNARIKHLERIVIKLWLYDSLLASETQSVMELLGNG